MGAVEKHRMNQLGGGGSSPLLGPIPEEFIQLVDLVRQPFLVDPLESLSLECSQEPAHIILVYGDNERVVYVFAKLVSERVQIARLRIVDVDLAGAGAPERVYHVHRLVGRQEHTENADGGVASAVEQDVLVCVGIYELGNLPFLDGRVAPGARTSGRPVRSGPRYLLAG